MKFKFFTDHTVENDYLLVKLKDYLTVMPKGNWKEVFVDPGVYELRKQSWYSWEKNIDIKKLLDAFPTNVWFSADYPCDMNPQYTRTFLDKSWTNAIRYCYHPQYIVTVQHRFNDYWDFIRWFDLYNELNIESGIMGLGNLCRIKFLTKFMKKSLDYAFSNSKHPRIHIYGLCMRGLLYAYNLSKIHNIELSVDSTNWTRPITNDFKNEVGMISCNKQNRQKYFDIYLQEIEKRILKQENNEFEKNKMRRISKKINFKNWL